MLTLSSTCPTKLRAKTHGQHYPPWLSCNVTRSCAWRVSLALTTGRAMGAQRRQVKVLDQRMPNSGMLDEETRIPIYVYLDKDALQNDNTVNHPEALRAGLKALTCTGITGVIVEVWWGLVEQQATRYDWSGYVQLLRIIRDCGLKAKVMFCFHTSELHQLPSWVLAVGKKCPDIFYADKSGARTQECLTLGIDEVPVLNDRTALQVYSDLMSSFRDTFGGWFGSTITACFIGMGPKGEGRYPSHPTDKRWNFPGVGEFQCYDRFMMASLRACAEQVGQQWGLSGPHDAGNYCQWPHQTGFFHHLGSWNTPYGKFFLQWYSDMLVKHMDSIMATAADVFADAEMPLSAKIPGIHWWYNQSAHAAELTAGIYNTVNRDGYLPIFKPLEKYHASLQLTSAEMRNSEQHAQALCDPEKQLAQQRTTAAALMIPVGLENALVRFDEPALVRLETSLFDRSISHGIELPQVHSLAFVRMCDAMYEPGNWQRFKKFVRKVQQRAENADLLLHPRPVRRPPPPVTALASPLPGSVAGGRQLTMTHQ